MTLAELSGPHAAPTHPQPGFYEAVVADLGYDPQAPIDVPLDHEEFSTLHAIGLWREQVLGDFDRHTGRFDSEAVEQAAKTVHPIKKPRKRTVAPKPPKTQA